MGDGWKKVLRPVILAAVFLIGVNAATILWEKIKLPFHNPWGITGVLTKQQYNPGSNLLRFAALVCLPSLLLLILFLFKIERIDSLCFRGHPRGVDLGLHEHLRSRSNIVWVLALVAITVAVALLAFTPFYVGSFDTFHDGETLGPAISYMQGQVPYKDFVMVHGTFQDTLRSVCAFKLFGESIGASRTLESILKTLTFILMALFVLRVFRDNYIYSLLTLLLLFSLSYQFIGGASIQIACMIAVCGFMGFFLYMAVYKKACRYLLPAALLAVLLVLQALPSFHWYIMSRDITTFSWLLTLPALQDFAQGRHSDPALLYPAAFFFSFIPVVSLAYSTDRGSYLLLGYLILFPAVYILYFCKSLYHRRLLLCSGLGLAAGILAFGLIIRGGFLDFFKFAFLIFPRYVSLLNGLILKKDSIPKLVIPALSTFWITYTVIREFRASGGRFRDRLDGFGQRHLVDFGLWLVSIIYYASVLQRADDNHFHYTAVFSYLFLIIIVMKYCLGHYLQDILDTPWLGKALSRYAAAATIVLFVSGSYLLLANRQDVNLVNFPVTCEDTELIPQGYQDAVAFLKENMVEGDEFLTLTSEGCWYYFLDIPCPVRFSSIFLASPDFYQEEVVEDLRSSNVTFVLYSNSASSNQLSNADNEERLPIILGYINANYVHYRTIESNDIWIRKDNLPPREPVQAGSGETPAPSGAP